MNTHHTQVVHLPKATFNLVLATDFPEVDPAYTLPHAFAITRVRLLANGEPKVLSGWIDLPIDEGNFECVSNL